MFVALQSLKKIQIAPYSSKRMVTECQYLTSTPSFIAGLNFAPRAALAAASEKPLSLAGGLITLTSCTRPFSSISTDKRTTASSFSFLAMAGYGADGRLRRVGTTTPNPGLTKSPRFTTLLGGGGLGFLAAGAAG